MKTATATKVIERLENLFSIYGYQEKLRHDNGPPFSSHEFKQYLRDVNITDKAITPEHPQLNAVVENFNRSLNKCLRIAKVQNSPWQNELRKMLLNYRNSVHSTTNVIPAQSFFKSDLKTLLPSINKKLISNLDHEIRKRQDENYKKVKEYTAQTRNAVHTELMKGDKALMLDNHKSRKLDSIYLIEIFEVIQIQHSTITVKNEN